MDLKKIISVSSKDLQHSNKKDELFKELCLIKPTDKTDSKILSKLFEVTQIILRYKGEQVSTLISEMEKLAKKQGDSLENVPVWSSGAQISNKRIDPDLSTVKEVLSENECRNECSEDSLSEIDRKREMLGNIYGKNKHIKKLIHEIKQLKKGLQEQNKYTTIMKSELCETRKSSNIIKRQHSEANSTIVEQEILIKELNSKIGEFEENIQIQSYENEKRERQIEEFTEQIKTRALVWKALVEEKLVSSNSIITDEELYPPSDTDKHNILEVLKIENGATTITDLKEKLEGLIKEVQDSLTVVREASSSNDINFSENSNLNELLHRKFQKYRQRCLDMEILFANGEDDVIKRAEQMFQTNNTLHALQTEDKSLTKALLKITELNSKINVRDSHIKKLIGELNLDKQNVSGNTDKISPIRIKATNARLLLTMNATDDLRLLQLKLEKSTNK